MNILKVNELVGHEAKNAGRSGISGSRSIHPHKYLKFGMCVYEAQAMLETSGCLKVLQMLDISGLRTKCMKMSYVLGS